MKRISLFSGLAAIIVALLILLGNDKPNNGKDPIEAIVKRLEKLDKQKDKDDHKKEENLYFKRLATFPVFLNSDIDNETSAEIVSATEDGMTLVYTDSPLEVLGFVDISDPANPQADGIIELGGEPTSVTVVANYALACVNTSESYTNPSGHLAVIDLGSRTIIREIDLGGQPDAIAASPDHAYAGVIIENERDEDLGDGVPPQAPSGYVVIVDLLGNVNNWTTRIVNLDGVAELFPEDAEPEFIDINNKNIAAVSLQENNHIVLIDLATGYIVNDFSAGSVNLTNIDTEENDLIELNSALEGLVREPDALTWIGNKRIATANEGDLNGGSRGFSIFNKKGNVRFDSGNNDDHLMVMIGHYPEDRSENKGNEAEGIEYGQYGNDHLLFVGSERSSVISVYDVSDEKHEDPRFIQVLPAGAAPEGILALPQRNLFIVASEEDNRGDKLRSSITIYSRDAEEASYPTVASIESPEGTPIPWAALSALASHPSNSKKAWTVYDSFYRKSRIFQLDTSGFPVLIEKEIVLTDSKGVFAETIATANANGYTDIVAANLINDDNTINVDPEGLARRADGGFWLASEGNGTIGDDDRPIKSHNWLFRVSNKGVIKQVVSLPEGTNARQVRFGLEGVTAVGSGSNEVLYVCIQREWDGDLDGHARIGRYEVASGEWTFFYYPLAEAQSPNGGWVGLSEIVATSDSDFLVVERDNQGGLDARIKKIFSFSIEGLTPLSEENTPNFPVVSKTEVRDLISDLLADNGVVIEKVEGLTILANGDALIVTDNDGVDDSSGETQLINLGSL